MRCSTIAGQSLAKAFTLVVHGTEDMDQMFTSLWEGMTGALISGDIASARHYLSLTAEKTYDQVFDGLAPDFPTIIPSWSQPFKSDISEEIGEYAVITTGCESRKFFKIYFLKDETEGVWRLDSM